MKGFIRNTIIFLFFSIFFTFLLIFISAKIIDEGDYFKINKDIKCIVIGHSHPECALNDSLIFGLKNFAESGDSYFYTYIKTKKILETNNQIKTVFIEFSNNQIEKSMDNKIWGDKYLSYKYPKYSSFMNINDLLFLSTKNLNLILNKQSTAFKKNIHFILKKNTTYIEYADWGGYLYLIRDKTDSLVNLTLKDTIVKDYIPELSEKNLLYLTKTIEICDKFGVNVYFIRCPLHQKYSALSYENEFQKILKTKYNNIEFLDFKDFPLENSEFGDLEHLNYKGARKFSLFFNQLLDLNILNYTNKQELINEEIEKTKRITYNSR
jgi:hypothetical protein